jgi:uncharacterized protein (TIGR02588 family)
MKMSKIIRLLPIDSPQTNIQEKLTQESVQEKPARKTFVEWLTLSISLGIVGGLVFLVLILWSSSKEKSPANPITQVKQEEIFSQSQQFYVPFELINQGDETAIQVQVVGELKRNGTIEQSGPQTIDFLSRRETRKGVFVFQTDPRQGNLSIRVTNYQIP